MARGRTGKRALTLELRAGAISSMVAKGEQAGRIAVYLDGRFAFDLAANVAAEAGLRRGDMLGEDRQILLLERDAPYRARDSALGMLSRREVTRREVVTRLHRAGFADEVVEGTVSWLEERGYLDDRRCAAAYVADRLRAGWGRRRIAAELLRRGVAREIVCGEAWEEMVQGQGLTDESETVVGLVRKRFAGQLAADPETAKRRLAGFLARRGHEWEAIAGITRQLCQEVGCGEDLPEQGTGGGEGRGSDDWTISGKSPGDGVP